VRDDGDLVALALERDRPLASAYGLSDIRGQGAVVERGAAVFAELDADTSIVERDLVAH
jgi:hypothetical protein